MLCRTPNDPDRTLPLGLGARVVSLGCTGSFHVVVIRRNVPDTSQEHDEGRGMRSSKDGLLRDLLQVHRDRELMLSLTIIVLPSPIVEPSSVALGSCGSPALSI
jgi:hypothetical protein